MAKHRGSGTFLGTTRRQRNESRRNYGILSVLFLILIIATVVLLFWMFGHEDSLPIPLPGNEAKGSPSAETDAQTGEPEPYVPYKPVSGQEAWVIMLDPGHGYDDAGSASPYLNGTNEAAVSLDIAKRLQKKLEAAGYTVLFTHSENAVGGRKSVSLGGDAPDADAVTLSPAERAEIANGSKIDCFVSLHCDGLPAGSDLSGMRVYCYAGTDGGDECGRASRALADLLAGFLPKDAEGNPAQARSLSKKNAYEVLRDVKVPAVLCELGYVSKESDAEMLSSADGREELAEALCMGILAYTRG